MLGLVGLQGSRLMRGRIIVTLRGLLNDDLEAGGEAEVGDGAGVVAGVLLEAARNGEHRDRPGAHLASRDSEQGTRMSNFVFKSFVSATCRA